MVTVDDLAKELGFASTPADTESMQRALDSAVAALDPHIIVTDYIDHPMYEMSLLTVAADFYRQKDAPRGVYTFADGSDISVNPLPRNVLPAIWPWLTNAGLVEAAVIA